MAIAIVELAPLLHTLFGIVLWLIIINGLCYMAAIHFERISVVIDSLPMEGVLDEDKIRILSLYDNVINGVGMRIAWTVVSSNPFRLHLNKALRLFPSLSVEDEDKLNRKFAQTLLLRSPIACLLAMVLYIVTFVGVYIVLMLLALLAVTQNQPSFSIISSAFVAQAKSGLSKVSRESHNPLIQLVS